MEMFAARAQKRFPARGVRGFLVALVLATGGCDDEAGVVSTVASGSSKLRELGNAPAASRARVADSVALQPVASTSAIPEAVDTVARPPGSEADVAPTSSAAPMRAKSRRGIWIWDFSKNAPPPDRAAALAAKWGVGRVFIKSSEGAGGVRISPPPGASAAASGSASTSTPQVLPPTPRWAQNFRPENVDPFLRRGIEVWAFGYFYPDRYVDPDGVSWGSLEAQVAASMATMREGITGLVVDAESEFDGKPADATKLCRLLRAKMQGRPLAYTSFGWISVQKKFPFKAFDAGCGDAFLPQVYYDFGWPGGALPSLARMRTDAAALGLQAPIWPVQSNERNATIENLSAFFGAAGPDSSVFYMHPEDTDQTRRLGALEW